MLGKRRPARNPDRSRTTRQEQRSDADEPGVEVLRLAHDGRGVARSRSGKTMFVERALPGERVSIAVHHARRRYDEAHVREIMRASTDRQTPECEYFGRCGGCDLQHMVLSAQREHKRSVLCEQLARHRIVLDDDPIMVATEGFGYRRRARLGVKVDATGQVHCGFRAAGSRHLVDIAHCAILVPSLSSLLTPLSAVLSSLEAPHLVGHVELLDSEAGGCVIVRQLRPHPEDERRWRTWASSNDVHLGWLAGRQEPILQWAGGVTPRLYYRLATGSRELHIGFKPGDFLQVNAEVNQCLIDTVIHWVRPFITGGDVLDLFAGVGNFSLAMAVDAASVTGVEGSAAMVERLADNARHNALDNVISHQGDLMQTVDVDRLLAASCWDLVILDPPRGGADILCQALAERQPKRILYISCDPATLARDAACLVQGGYRITASAIADMFSQTAHLESALLFETVHARP
ncbi:RsmD family RNA methyltransferase [Aidingimonas lacisalsi]|uniref:RsmD family RNA methyltransferase n=1 Tax=Aidingimonas lacisalsi TaxID=2604086 RepID=UPI002ED0E72E